MAKRLLTSGIGLVVFFCVLASPPTVFKIALLFVTAGAIFEIHRAVTKNKILTIIGLIISVGIYLCFMYNMLLAAIIGTMSVYMLLSVIFFGKEKVSAIYMLGFSNIVFSLFLSCLAGIRSEHSAYTVLLPFLFAWITDSGAYFTGCSIGKHKLAPQLSPKKTIEGSVGGIVSCVLLSMLYVFILDKCFSYTLFEGNNYLKISVLSFIASIISQLGDLASSAIKRDFEVKDFGNILPGHGGILDRFDSVVFVSPVVYYALQYLLK